MTTWIKLPRVSLPSGNPSRWGVQISYDHERFPGCYGYFEHDDWGEGGGLWFEYTDDAKWSLRDYDGKSSLPMSVIHTLRHAGLIVTEDFE